MNNCCSSVAAFLGRILLSAIFLYSAYGKITGWEQTRHHMEARGMPAASVGLPIALIAEVAGGVGLLLGFRARWAAALLIVFLIPATLYFHNFWTYAPEQQMNQMLHFFKNVAIVGGLLTVAAHGAGGCSLDAWCTCKRAGRAPSDHEAPPQMS